jgi:hypothetical protein
MSNRAYASISAAVFTALGLVQLTRAVRGWPVEIAGQALPVWPSWLAGVVMVALAIWGWRLVATGNRVA